jgi:hypothetical protein
MPVSVLLALQAQEEQADGVDLVDPPLPVQQVPVTRSRTTSPPARR